VEGRRAFESCSGCLDCEPGPSSPKRKDLGPEDPRYIHDRRGLPKPDHQATHLCPWGTSIVPGGMGECVGTSENQCLLKDRILPLLSSLAHRLERRTGAKAKLCGPQGGQGPQSLLLNLGGLASFSLLICLQCLTVPESQGTVPNFSLLETSQHFLGSGLLLRGSMLIRKRPPPVWLSETLL
jgi:hypothetical protein